MPDLFLNWGDLGPYGSEVVSATTDAGGVNVSVNVDGVTEGDQGFTVENELFVEAGEPFNPNSSIKIYGDTFPDPGSATNNVSTTVVDFSSSDDAYGDSVENVMFRINDIDTGTDDAHTGDVSGSFQDIVTIRAYDEDGNEVPVTFTPGSGVSVSGNTLTGTGSSDLDDASGSVLVEIAGPVARIEVDYDNGGDGEAYVNMTDVHFSTTDAVNEAPVAEDDTASTDEDVILPNIDVLGNDSDPDGDPLTVTDADAPNGTVTINPDGTLNYEPDPDFNGEDTITYTIEDPDGETDTGEVIVTVDPVNDAPVANDDTASTPEDTLLEDIPVLANDDDVDGDPLTVTAADAPNGTVTINPDGTLNYEPDPDFSGEDTITYTVEDPDGATDTAEVVVTVGGTNDAPVAGDDTATTPEDTPLDNIDVLGNDSDPDGDPLTVTDADAPNGTVTVNPDGTLNYEPDPDFNGEDTITYTVEDPDGATDTAEVIVTVDPVNDAPVANDDAASTPEDTLLEDIPVLANDDDVDGDPLTVTAADAPNGTVTINPDGTLDYLPDPGFNGEDTITYTIEDPDGETDTADVIVTVGGVNDAPVAVDDVADTPEDTPLDNIDVLGNDSDPDGDPLTVTAADAPNGTVTINPDGTLNYEPDPDFNGEDIITYTVEDPDGATSTAEVVVTVDPVNDAPVAEDDSDSTDVGTPVTVDVLGNDSDPEGDPLTVTDVTDGTNGMATVTGTGTIEYTPNPGFTGEDTVTYTIDDGNGGTDTADVVITVGSGLPLDGIVEGTNGPDTIDGGYLGDPEGDVVDGGDNIFDPDPEVEDEDIIEAGGGDDLVEAGDDNDTVYAGTGDDTVDGGDGDDELFGEQGEDDLDGGDGDDRLVGGADDDTLTGGNGNDTVLGEQGNDEIDTSGDDPAIDVPTFPGIPVDGAPDDDRDLVFGGDGDDTITTGDDRDTIEGGEGDDVINPGIDDDDVTGGGGDDLINDVQGSDTIDGGGGADTIIAGVDTFSDYVGDDPNLPIGAIEADPNPDDGRDLVFGGAGNDSIETGDDADTIDGGTGNDTIDGGIDDDEIDGFVGNDSIIGGHGSDTILGGEGDDSIDASAATSPTDFTNEPDDTDPVPTNDRDFVDGGDGNDTIFGGDDDDTLLGGAGDDQIDGGIDEDSIEGGDGADGLDGGDGADDILGGDGDDTIDGGEGPDFIDAGDGRDSIIGGDDGDFVDGGSGPDGIDPGDGLPWDYDTLDLTGIAPPGGSVTVTYTSADREDGIVEIYDDTRTDTSAPIATFTFEDIENIVPCFTPGTTIATPTGERLVEDLREGDRVITRDNGLQEIRWIGRKELTGHMLARAPHLRPVLIQAGSLGPNLPEHDILVSPQHRMLINNDRSALYFEEREVLAAAKHLTDLDGVDEVGALGVTYIHFMFDHHEVVLSNGVWSESFQPGDQTMDGMGAEQRAEIFELFPELETEEGLKDYASARRSLKKHEAKLLLR